MTTLSADWLQLQEIAQRLSTTDPAEFAELPSLTPTIALLLQSELARARESGDTEAAGLARAVSAITESLERF
ncbi:hypothetical protein VZG28_14565 (plasmid) [Synechococcus elongatus IITB4]|uniref:hypothetical protein n=1 Tax=Synechococcus elongatus TaxID=32046 RepID=UPI0030CE7CDE